MTKRELEQQNDRLILALQRVVSNWEISRDIRGDVDAAKVVLAESRELRSSTARGGSGG